MGKWSLVEPALEAVGASGTGWVEILDAGIISRLGRENAVGQVPHEGVLQAWRAPVPTSAMLVMCLTSSAAGSVRAWLSRFYPDAHTVEVVRDTGAPDASVHSLPLSSLDELEYLDEHTVLYVPPLADLDNVRTFAGLMQITRRLRGPGGCPWDREQSHDSLKTYLLEEAYEVIEALDSSNPELLAEEMGDLLYQITLHSQVAAEAGEFTIEDVFQNIVTKMVGRHPHVFGDLDLETAQDVRHAWEGFKQRQKPKRASVMQDIPTSLPAIPRSNLMQKRAASVGFEWPTVAEVLDKVEEELDELRADISDKVPKEQQREELGDIFFALVSVARHLKIDPEEALRLANSKFAGRFSHVESHAKQDGKVLRDLSPAELDRYWNQAKQGTSHKP